MEKTFDAAAAESRIYAAWEEAGCFAAGANAKRTETYCIMAPPPNVTGSLHMGHAFNNTLQDILIRWHRMRGFDTLWQPGQDHAGIATQMVVERKLDKTQQASRTEMGRAAFLDKVWEWKGESGDTIINQLKRLGASCDWSRNAFTMSGAPGAPAGEGGNFHDAVIKAFVDLYNKGLIYRGKRLVNWDPHFETAISDLEVENIKIVGYMWHFKYLLADGETYKYVEKDADGNITLEEERNYISIATTRPETMLGDGAVAVHPSDERYAPIIGKLCEIPVGPQEHRRLIPIITDGYPDPDFGSGAVKITGAHDFNDYAVAKRGGIPMYSLMDTKGAMRSDGKPYAEEAEIAQKIATGEVDFDEAMIATMNLVPDEYRGLDRFEARKRVVADITAEGLAVMLDVPNQAQDGSAPAPGEDPRSHQIPFVEKKPIMQPFGDRSKVVIEPMLTDQWFVNTSKIVGPALAAVQDGTVTILPESGKKTYQHWLENIEPWCISRQLWWGHQIPVWYGFNLGGNLTEGTSWTDLNFDIEHLSKALAEPLLLVECSDTFQNAARAIKNYVSGSPVSPFNSLQIVEVANREEALTILANQIASWKNDGNLTSFVYPMWRDPDVLDTWFSSGLWPIGTLGWPEETDELRKFFPTSTLVTGQDILFFWVARMMMMQLAVVDKIPFYTVYLHSLVRDIKGKKMSKSLGNVIDPLKIIDEYGADALRFSSAAIAALGGVLKLDMQRIAGYRNFGTKLWNAMRFAEINRVFSTAAVDGIPTPQQMLNKWILGETAKVRVEVDVAFEAYRFNDAANALYAFIWGKVCDWYLEFSKPLMQGADADIVLETRQTMKWVLDQCLILLHPIMPFITEELWGISGTRAKMLIHADWPEYGLELVDSPADKEMSWVIALIENTRSVRAQMHVPAGRYMPMLMSSIDAAGQAAWDRNATLIKHLARIEDLTQADIFPKGTISIPAEGASFGLPLANISDIAEEKARLEKALGKLSKELGGLRERLSNPKFITSAPQDVVEETRENLALHEEGEAKLKDALTRLAELA